MVVGRVVRSFFSPILGSRWTKRKQVAFAEDCVRKGITDYKQVAWKWMEAQGKPPRDVPKVQDTFGKILARRSLD